MDRIVLPKSPALVGDVPNWYLGHKTHSFGNYYGSLGSLFLNETYVTHDLKQIVHRDQSGNIAVSRNACAHAGALLVDRPGEYNGNALICPLHRWGYDLTGQCIAAKAITDPKSNRLQSETFGIWNGYVLGYNQESLDTGLAQFGEELRIGSACLNTEEFVFVGTEEVYPMPYPKEVFAINFIDGYHVPFTHVTTFDAVIDCGTYAWELSPQRTDCPVWYSTQVVRARKDVERHRDFLVKNYSNQGGFGWVNLHLWLKEVMSDVETPLDPEIFAVWSMIYGNGYLMLELYEGGRFLAVSSVVTSDPQNVYEGNYNLVEYYVHKSVPSEIRAEAASKFKHAYEQSAREDDEICKKLWKAHNRDMMNFNRLYHGTLEKGDPHFRSWFLNHFTVRE